MICHAMRTDLFDYDLPPERIAQTPVPRGASRLLVLGRKDGQIAHRRFSDLIEYLWPGDCLVMNDTRVTARRLRARRESGLPAEALLLRPSGETCWEALVHPGKSLRPGKTLTLFGPDNREILAAVQAETPEGGRLLDFGDRRLRDEASDWGETPLPPYIHTPLAKAEEARYQTVYAVEGGSSAAPTAGLHFTQELLEQIEAKGVLTARVTLHVGVGTFRPVRTEEIEAHEMHAETFHLTEQAAGIINAAPGRIIAVGTTSTRVLETAGRAAEERASPEFPRVVPMAGETRLFLTPGSRFRVVEGLVTNFHLPRSTLLMLVSAFSTREYILRAYAEAIREEYRFFSFGDAMLII
jgi:S-adenosylmethionine:tRNA ribosyltransferase-isomerase